MAHVRKNLYIEACFISAMLIIQSQSHTHIKGNLPEISGVLKFLQSIIRPYIRTLGTNTNALSGPHFRTKNPSIEKFVIEKVAQLKPYLQENDVTIKEDDTDENLTLEGKEDTTIIEFLPNKNKGTIMRGSDKKTDTLKANVKRYKKLRKTIKNALLKENVSVKTSSLITNTLDDMIAKIIENKCSWKSSSKENDKQTKVDRAIAMAQQWNQQWAEIREDYDKYSGGNSTSPGAKLFVFFEQFHDFLSHITKDMESMSGQYKLVCRIVDRERKPDQPASDLRIGDNTVKDKKKHKCNNFKVCSEELAKFMIDFYYALNDTAVSTLRNYASMYIRDVNTDDSQEKESVVSVLNNISDLTEYKASSIFKKETKYFQLDRNKNADENIKILKIYIMSTIENTKNYIKNSLETGLKSLRARLYATVKQDLNVNIDMDLGNLERDFRGTICSAFSVCNGKYAGRRHIEDNPLFDRNSVYVKVQMTLDEDLKKKLSNQNFESYFDFNKLVQDSAGIADTIITDDHKISKKKNIYKKKYTTPSDAESEEYITKRLYSHNLLESYESKREKKKKKLRFYGTMAHRRGFQTARLPNVTRTTLMSPTNNNTIRFRANVSVESSKTTVTLTKIMPASVPLNVTVKV